MLYTSYMFAKFVYKINIYVLLSNFALYLKMINCRIARQFRL